MKKNTLIIAAFAALLGIVACNPIEDQMLREKYITNAGKPMTPAELTSHLSVSQISETNDVITVVNNDPSIGGIWHFTTATGDAILKSDKGTYTYTANGTYDVYMVAPTAGNKLVESEHFQVTVSDVYDPWVGLLTGAKDKFDKTAKKTWGFRIVTGAGEDSTNPNDFVCCEPAYGFWKWYAPTTVTGQDWGGARSFATAGDQKMVLEYDGQKLTTYKADGTVNNSGAFAVNHTSPDTAGPNTPNGVVAMGTITTTVQVPGQELGKSKGVATPEFLILELTDNHLVIFNYAKYPGPDWDDNGWIAYYKAE